MPQESRAECRLEGLQAKAGPHAVLAFVASETGQMDAPERPGHFPRQGAQAVGASESSCSFLQCWLQEFLDPLPQLRAGCTLEVPGEGFGSSDSARFQLLERVFVGMQSPLQMGRMLPQPTRHGSGSA